MIYLTNNILLSNIDYIRKSSIVEHGKSYFQLIETIDELVDDNYFYFPVNDYCYMNVEEHEYDEKFKGGIIESIEWYHGLTKLSNIAGSIYMLSENAGMDPFELWESAIEEVKNYQEHFEEVVDEFIKDYYSDYEYHIRKEALMELVEDIRYIIKANKY